MQAHTKIPGFSMGDLLGEVEEEEVLVMKEGIVTRKGVVTKKRTSWLLRKSSQSLLSYQGSIGL